MAEKLVQARSFVDKKMLNATIAAQVVSAVPFGPVTRIDERLLVGTSAASSAPPSAADRCSMVLPPSRRRGSTCDRRCGRRAHRCTWAACSRSPSGASSPWWRRRRRRAASPDRASPSSARGTLHRRVARGHRRGVEHRHLDVGRIGPAEKTCTKPVSVTLAGPDAVGARRRRGSRGSAPPSPSVAIFGDVAAGRERAATVGGKKQAPHVGAAERH